jgi:hypothetical protein
MKPNPDSSLTIYVQAGNRGSDEEANWLPAPKDENFSLYAHTYWPKVQVTDGSRAPPPVNKVERLSYGRRGTSPRHAVGSYELTDLGSLGGQQHARPASSQGKVKPQALFGNRRCSMRTSRFSFRDSNMIALVCALTAPSERSRETFTETESRPETLLQTLPRRRSSFPSPWTDPTIP